MIELAGDVKAADLRPDVKELTEDFDNLESAAFLEPEKLRKLLSDVRRKTFTVLQKVGNA